MMMMMMMMVMMLKMMMVMVVTLRLVMSTAFDSDIEYCRYNVRGLS